MEVKNICILVVLRVHSYGDQPGTDVEVKTVTTMTSSTL